MRASPFLFDEIEFLPVRPAEKERNVLSVAGDADAPLRIWCLSRADEREPLPKGKAADAAIQATAAEIARLLAAAGRGEARIGETALRGGDIAVLVRTNAQADRVRAALLARGVASVQLGEASVFETHEAAEIERVLLAVAQPGRESLVRAALATDLFGLGGNALEVARRGRGGLGGAGERVPGVPDALAGPGIRPDVPPADEGGGCGGAPPGDSRTASGGSPTSCTSRNCCRLRPPRTTWGWKA